MEPPPPPPPRPDPPGPPRAPPTHWGICGAGRISHDFAVALSTLPPAEHVVVAVAARELGRAQEFARRHGLPRAYGSYAELAQDPDVDVAYVGTVTAQHVPAARALLGGGRAVLVEKPMALGPAQVRELAAAARARGLFLMEGYWTRFFPAWQRLQELVAGGALGEPLLLLGALGQALGGLERVREPALGGGALLDLGGYGLQMATALLGGAPRRLRAQGVLHPTGVDETVTLTLEFGGRRRAVLSCSMAAELPGGAVLGGTRGWAEFPSHMNCPTELVLAGGRRERFPLPPPPQPLHYPHTIGLRYQAQHVRECLLRGLTESPVMPLAESELLAGLLLEARRQVGVGHAHTEPGHAPTEPGHAPTEPGHAHTEEPGPTGKLGHAPTEPGHAPTEEPRPAEEPGHAHTEEPCPTEEPGPMGEPGHAPTELGHAHTGEPRPTGEPGHAPTEEPGPTGGAPTPTDPGCGPTEESRPAPTGGAPTGGAPCPTGEPRPTTTEEPGPTGGAPCPTE